MRVRRDIKSAIQLVTTVGHFEKWYKHTLQNNLVKGRESWSVSLPTYRALSRSAVWGGVVGRKGWGVEEAFTFPDPCSLERWLDVKLACTDRCGEGNEMWASTVFTTRSWHPQKRGIKWTEK